MLKTIGRRPLMLRGLAAAMLATGMIASPVALAQTKSVAVTAIVEHPALNSVRDGIKEELEAAGFNTKVPASE